MKNLFFWNIWSKPYRNFYKATLFLFTIATLFFAYSQFFGKNMSLGWRVDSEVNSTKLVVDSFQKGFFQFDIDVSNQYLLQSFEGQPYQLIPLFSYLLLASIGLLLIFGSVAISYLNDLNFYIKELGYYIALTVLGLFVYFLNLEVLEVFGWTKMYWPVIVFLSYGGAIHYFRNFRPETRFSHRYLAFTGLTVAFFGVTLTSAQVPAPALQLAAYGWLAPFGAALLFIFLTAGDIFNGFLYITTDSKNAKSFSSLLNFLVISLIYLGNLTLTFLRNRKSIDWELIYLEAPLLLVIAAILGIWAHKKKEPIYRFIVDFSPITASWYLILGANCFLCYAFANLTGNDPLQEVFEDGVIFSHICVGIVFLLYVASNFMGFMNQNLPVHMVAYKPNTMPFGFVRIIAIVGMTSIILYNSMYQWRQARAGYYLCIADVYVHQEQDLLADEYLKSALWQDASGHKPNYAMAMLIHKRAKDELMVKAFLKEAMFKNPSPQAYANLGLFLLRDGDIIRSLEALREGKRMFPKSAEILNNLALAYTHTDIQDSTLYYFQQARRVDESNPVPLTNQLAFALKHNIVPEVDQTKLPNDPAYQANLIAVLNKAGKTFTAPIDTSFLTDSALTPAKTAYVLNLAMNDVKNSSFRLAWLDSLSKKQGNALYSEELLLAKAYRQYYSGQIADGIITLDQLQGAGVGTAQYNNTLANWLLQQNAPRMAVDFLYKAKDAGDRNADFGLAIATSFYETAPEALHYWQSPVIHSDSSFRMLSQALQGKSMNVYTIGILPQLFPRAESLYQAFYGLPAGNDKNKALGRLMAHLNEHGQAPLAIKLYEENPKTTESKWEYLRALRKTNQASSLAVLDKTVFEQPATHYLVAWANETTTPSVAQQEYQKALALSPFYEDGILDAVRFLKGKVKEEAIYDILLQSVMLNPHSASLQQQYALQAVRLNLFGYADVAVEKLKTLLTAAEHAAFTRQIASLKEETMANVDWNK